MDEEDPKKSEQAVKSASEEPTAEPSESDADPAAPEPEADAAEQPAVSPMASTTSARDIVKTRASALRDPFDGGIARTMRELNMTERMARDLGLLRGPLDDLISGRNQLPGVARAIADAQRAMEAVGGFSALHDRMTRTMACGDSS